MRKALLIFVLAIVVLLPSPPAAFAEFNAAEYAPATQADLVKTPDAHVGKKYRVTDLFQFCGSDFCGQILKTKINTKEYYCFTLGPVIFLRMYVKKDHPDAAVVLKLRKGEKVTVFGTFDYMGSNYHYLVADRVVAGN